ncbi:MAG: guanylate kinase [Anaerolineae bacterium]|nr:guanylate kinase [Anaerolineae bacterium]
MPNDGLLFILVGPTAAGKNTLLRAVNERLTHLDQLATATTRKKRPDERQGREHLFVSLTEFRDMIARNELVEYENVHDDDWYGTPRIPVEEAFAAGKDLIADIECLGAKHIYADYPDNTVLIFVSPSSAEVLAERIRLRGNVTAEEIASRLGRARFEMAFARHCHYLILNDLVEPAVEHLRQIIVSERARRRAGVQPPAQMIPRPAVHCMICALVVHDDHLLVRADSAEVRLPTFAMPADITQSPADFLEDRLGETLHLALTVDRIVDPRFDESAPHLVSLAAIPYDVYFYYTYRCSASSRRTPDSAEWVWRPVTDLRLPDALARIIAAPAG